MGEGMANILANNRLRIVRRRVKYITRCVGPNFQIKITPKQEVKPSDIIAQGLLLPGFRNLNISQVLQVSPKEIKTYLQRQIGQKIFKGELLVFKPATLISPKKVLVSPTDGVLEHIDEKTGELRMSFIPKSVSIPAAVFGVVEEVDQTGGKVIIKTEVTEIFGVFGSGKTREGILHVLGRRGDLTGANRVLKEHQGNVLVSGGLIYKEAISAAISQGVNGLITGGINAKDYLSISGGELKFPRTSNTDIGTSVIACEGFGSIPLGQDIFDELNAFDGKFAIIDGNSGKVMLPSYDESCIIRVRKTALLKDKKGLVEPLVLLEAVEIKIGQLVRVIGAPFMGEQGKVISIDKTGTLLPSGINVIQLTIETLTRKIQVPHPNVEVLE